MEPTNNPTPQDGGIDFAKIAGPMGISRPALDSMPEAAPDKDASQEVETGPDRTRQTLDQALSVFEDCLAVHPYVTFSFRDEQTSGKSTTVHLSRPNDEPDGICVNIVPESPEGVRYSDISLRAFGAVGDSQVTLDQSSLHQDLSEQDAQTFLSVALRCQRTVEHFRSNDLMVHFNPQGVQEFINQPSGGIRDTGGQNQYTKFFSRALGATTPEGADNPPCQLILNRGGDSQEEIQEKAGIRSDGPVDSSVRRGMHFFPEDNVALAFVEDHETELLPKEQCNPTFTRLESNAEVKQAAASRGGELVTVRDEALEQFGIEDGTYMITEAGRMFELAKQTAPLMDYLAVGSDQSEDARRVISINHYVDAAYHSEFLQRQMGVRFENYFLMHSLGTFKAQGKKYPEALESEAGQAEAMDAEFDFTNRILGELWVVQNARHIPLANSQEIGRHSENYLGSDRPPLMLPAVDDQLFSNHISRTERATQAFETFQKLHDFYTATCNDERLGIVPEEQRLSLEQLMDSMIVFERSRHGEAYTKGKHNIVKAMAIAQQKPINEDFEKVLVINVNLDALHGTDENFRKEIQSIVADVKSIRENGGHVIMQPKFDFEFGADVCRVTDCYIALPALEPWGMGALEAASAGAPMVASTQVRAIVETVGKNAATIPVRLNNKAEELSVSEGAILVDPDHAYTQAAAAIRLLTSRDFNTDTFPTANTAVELNVARMTENAIGRIQAKGLTWTGLAQNFISRVYPEGNA